MSEFVTTNSEDNDNVIIKPFQLIWISQGNGLDNDMNNTASNLIKFLSDEDTKNAEMTHKLCKFNIYGKDSFLLEYTGSLKSNAIEKYNEICCKIKELVNKNSNPETKIYLGDDMVPFGTIRITYTPIIKKEEEEDLCKKVKKG